MGWAENANYRKTPVFSLIGSCFFVVVVVVVFWVFFFFCRVYTEIDWRNRGTGTKCVACNGHPLM